MPPSTAEALELRRKYNRESMQRTRAREREALEQMRSVLAQLEREFSALTLQTRHARNPMRVELRALSAATKQLHEENFSLRQDLEHRRKCYERVERILADYHAEKADDLLGAGEEAAVASAPSAASETPLITEDEAFALIVRCSQATIESAEWSARRIAGNPTPAPAETSSLFGWDVRRGLGSGGSASRVHFHFTKTFANLDAARAATSAWEVYRSLERNNVKPIRVVRFDTLQVVNENTHVVARDIMHPRHEGVVLRSVFLRFRVESEKGFVVGRSCMNPAAGASGPARVRFADLSTWLELNYADPSRREQAGCEVKFSGFCDYGTTYDLNARFIDVLFSVLQMENRVLEPLLPLLQ
ncbi:hypothetical protein PybrP1_003834 [[Pythium] brassicae (nom. inval.)]|nr:hypothetical protein PybrP1_003834 [[Pythium] brassicae (nom. inval.)]